MYVLVSPIYCYSDMSKLRDYDATFLKTPSYFVLAVVPLSNVTKQPFQPNDAKLMLV